MRRPRAPLQIKFCPNRRVIGRFLSFAHFSIDPGGDALFGEGFACQNGVDAQSAIFWKRKHPVIPPAEISTFFVMQPQGVDQTDVAQLPEGRALAVRAHDSAAPQLRVDWGATYGSV